MKANRAQIERALGAPSPEIRFFLLHGPDESQSRELAARLAKSLGPGAERIDLAGAALKGDPARLADEAAALSLFGGARHIRVDATGDEIFEAVEALLESPGGGNPVVIVAGALRKDSKVLKRALADPGVLAFASHVPEGGEADRLATAMAREAGLSITQDVASRLAASANGDRALIAREIEKFATYLDAAPDRPAALDDDAYAALSADSGDGDLSRLIDAALGGRTDRATAEISRLASDGVEGIAILRPLLRRLLQLAGFRAQIDQGDSIDATLGSAGRAIFWKEKDAVRAQLMRWSAPALATAIDRIASAERAVKASGSAGPLLVEVELLAIARAAARMRG